jgi:hypothetical protein
MGPLADLARANRKAREEKRIRAEADKRPPRVERVPALAPIPQPIGDFSTKNEVWRLIELNKPPEHRVTMVPILPPPQMLRIYDEPSALSLASHMSEAAQFQAVEYGMDFAQMGGGTRVRWWGYEHVGEARQKYRGLNRTAAYAERVRFAFDQIFGPRRAPEHDSFWERLMQTRLPVPVETLREWVDVVIEDVEQALGKP